MPRGNLLQIQPPCWNIIKLVHGLSSTTGIGFVQDIIMDQRCHMDHFYNLSKLSLFPPYLTALVILRCDPLLSINIYFISEAPMYSHPSAAVLSVLALAEAVSSGSAAATALATSCTMTGLNLFPCLFSKKCLAAMERIG